MGVCLRDAKEDGATALHKSHKRRFLVPAEYGMCHSHLRVTLVMLVQSRCVLDCPLAVGRRNDHGTRSELPATVRQGKGMVLECSVKERGSRHRLNVELPLTAQRVSICQTARE